MFVPGAIISSHGKHALSCFGPAPFSVVALRSHLKTFNPETSFRGDTFRQDHSSLPDAGTLSSQPPVYLEEPEPNDNGAIPVGDLLASDFSPAQPSASDISLWWMQLVLVLERKFLDLNLKCWMNLNLT